MDGWIKIFRSMLEWEWYDDTNVVRLFLHLLLTANYEPKKWHGQRIERGTLITGRIALAEETHLSEQQVRTALKKLESTGEITIKATNQYSVITICNYDKYQIVDNSEQPTNQPTDNQRITNEQPTNNQRITTTKERKKERKKEYNNIIPPLYSPQGETAFPKSEIEFWAGEPVKVQNELTNAEMEMKCRITTTIPTDIQQELSEAEKITPEQMGVVVNPEKEKEKSCAKKEKEQKHKYGEYENVLLTDTEAEKLRKEFGDDTLPIVMHFSELKAMKGYKYKSDYLAIRKWGATAYYEHQKRNQNGNNADSFATIQERAARSVELGDAISRMWP